MKPGSSLKVRWSSNPGYANGLVSASGIFGVSSGVFLASSVIFVLTSTIIEESDELLLLRCCKQLPDDDFFALLVIILLGMVDLSVLALFFRERIYFRVVKIDNFNLLTRAPVFGIL